MPSPTLISPQMQCKRWSHQMQCKKILQVYICYAYQKCHTKVKAKIKYKVEKKPPYISPDRRLWTQCYAELYAVLRDACGSVVDLWVRGGTRAVPSQCSGPPDSFSGGPGFEPGTLCVIPHVSNHLATWADHERWWKKPPLIPTLTLHHYKKSPRPGIGTTDLTIQTACSYPSDHTQ